MTFKIKKWKLSYLKLYYRLREGGKALKSGFLFVFLMGCGLQIGEAPPPVPVYSLKDFSEEEVCSSLDYKGEIKDYFLNWNEPKSESLAQALNCLSVKVAAVSSLIYNEFLTREELLAVLDDDVIDFQNLREPFKKYLSPEFRYEFALYKNYIFQLIDPNLELQPSAICVFSGRTPEESHLSLNEDGSLSPASASVVYSEVDSVISPELSSPDKDILLSQSDIDVILNFLGGFQNTLSLIEEKSQFLFKGLLEYEERLAEGEYERRRPTQPDPETNSPAEGEFVEDSGEKRAWSLFGFFKSSDESEAQEEEVDSSQTSTAEPDEMEERKFRGAELESSKLDFEESLEKKSSELESGLEGKTAPAPSFFRGGEAEHQVWKRALSFSKPRALNFTRLLEESLSDSFPSYSRLLKEQLELVKNSSKELYGMAADHSFYFLREEIDPLLQSLYLFSDEEPVHLLDLKYLFMMIYSMEFLFQNYDRNKNLTIDDEELRSFSCLIEPFLSPLLEEKTKGRAGWIQYYYRSDKIIRYIFKYQEAPSPWSVKYLFFDPDEDITLSFKEVSRLLRLLFKSSIKELKALYPEDFNREPPAPNPS